MPSLNAIIEGITRRLNAHASRHQDGGADEISLAGLLGLTAQLAIHEAITNAATGFPNRTDSALSFAGATFTIAPSSTTFDYYIAGVKYTKSSSENIVLADTSGVQLIYYDGSTLSKSVNPNTATLEDILLNKAWVATIYWQTTGAGTGVSPLLADERHGAVMSGETHLWLHTINGAAYSNGLTLSGYTEATDSDAALTFELTDGEYDDEDLEHTIVDGSPATQYAQQLNGGDAEIPIVYKISGGSSGVWVEDAASTLPYKLISGGNRLAYNRDDGGGNWSQQEVTDGKWVSMTLIATNDWQYPIKAIQGQNEYTDKKTAVEEATAEIIAFGGGTLSPEVITLYRFVMQTKDTFSGTKKAKIETDGVTDFRRVTVIGGAAVAVDHGALGGLADDDHAQYILHSLADATNDFLVASGNDAYVKKTLAETKTILSLTDYVTKALFDAQTILAATSDDTPAALTVTEQTLVGRITSGNIAALSIAQVKTLLGAGAASGLASLNASTKVVEQPASITDHLDDTAGGTDAETTKAPTSNVMYDHGVLTSPHSAASAATASRLVVRDASARAKFAQSAAAGDAIVADANNRAPNATLLEGSSKAQVQDHTPKAHTAASHSDQDATGAELEELTDGSETALHSHAAAGVTTVTGSYTGDDANNRQITTGFECSLVIVFNVADGACWIVAGTAIGIKFRGGAIGNVVYTTQTDRVLLHATDGFIVDDGTANSANRNTRVYPYVAISV